MAIVYRVETPEGFGPYSKIAPELTSHENHRSPRAEGIEFPYYWYFGFRDLSLLTLWFSAVELEELKEYGQSWLLSKYEVPDDQLLSTAYQTVFDRRSSQSKLLGCLPLDMLAGSPRGRLSKERIAELEESFQPHEYCEPRPRFGLFEKTKTLGLDEGKYTLQEIIESLEEGRYYSAVLKSEAREDPEGYPIRFFLFRGGSLYPLRGAKFQPYSAEFQPLSVEIALADKLDLSTFGA